MSQGRLNWYTETLINEVPRYNRETTLTEYVKVSIQLDRIQNDVLRSFFNRTYQIVVECKDNIVTGNYEYVVRFRYPLWFKYLPKTLVTRIHVRTMREYETKHMSNNPKIIERFTRNGYYQHQKS